MVQIVHALSLLRLANVLCIDYLIASVNYMTLFNNTQAPGEQAGVKVWLQRYDPNLEVLVLGWFSDALFSVCESMASER